MCRFLAYVGEPVRLASLVSEPQYGLLAQCRTPRHQTRTKDNPDGFGVAWFEEGIPQRHRKPIPMWEDVEFLKRARSIIADAVVAGIRKATPGIPLAEENTLPYINGGLVFAHNGFVKGWVEGNDARVREMVSAKRLAEAHGTTDSEVLFGLVLDALDGGAKPADALGGTVARIADAFGGCLNLLLHDGSRITATSWGNSLFVLERDRSLVVASEPFDDDDDWHEVPDGMVVDGGRDGVVISRIPGVTVPS